MSGISALDSKQRRDYLKVAAGALLGAVATTEAAPAAIAGAAALDARLAYRKLHFRSDNGLVWWWLQGPKYGQVGTTLTPLFTMLVGTLQRVRLTADGGFDLTSLEMVFLADLDTGARLRQWRNPYTTEMLPVKFAPLGPSTVHYRAHNSRTLPTEIGGARLESSARSSAPVVVGDDVFIREESTYDTGNGQDNEGKCYTGHLHSTGAKIDF